MRRSIWLVSAIILAVAIGTAVVMLFHHRTSSGAPTQATPRLEMIPSPPPLTIHPTPPREVADQYPSRTAVIPPAEPQAVQPASPGEIADQYPVHPLHLNGDTNEPTAFAQLAEDEIGKLADGITLAKWMDQRGTPEQWEKDTENKIGITNGEDPKCADYQRVDELPSKALIIRTAYFYPPPAPVPAVFPSLNAEELLKDCLLGEVEIEASSVWEMDNNAFLQAVRQTFAKQYGESVDTKAAPFWRTEVDLWRPLFDRNTDRWIQNGVEIGSGIDYRPRSPLVRARLPLLKYVDQPAVRTQHDDSVQLAQFHQAVSVAGVDVALSQRMEKLYELEVQLADRLNKQAAEMCKAGCPDVSKLPKAVGDDWRDPLVPVLGDWLNAIKTVDSTQRAAGLFAADRLLIAFESVRPGDHFGTAGSSTAAQDKLRTGLKKLGANFATSYAAAAYYYTGNWLDEAGGLDFDGESGRMAFFTWVQSNSDICLIAGAETFRKVISRGEMLLSRKLDPTTASKVHFMVGDAYSDIYTIAKGYDQNGTYTNIGGDQAEPARLKGLEHYRAGLAIDNTSDEAKDAWRQAWHLSAGRMTQVRYACFGD